MLRSWGWVALSLCSFARPGFAEVVKLCVEDWPPYTVVKNKKVEGGSTVDLAREALKRKGHTLEVDYLPFARCLEMVKEGKRDAVADASASQNEKYSMISGKNMTSLWSLAVWVREDDPLQEYKSLDAFEGKRVGLVESYDYPDVVKNFKKWKVDNSTTDQVNLNKLVAKRTDIVVSDIINTGAVVREGKFKVRYVQPSIVADPLFVAFTNKKPQLMRDFDEGLGSMIQDGTADRIYEQHLGGKYTVLNGVQPPPVMSMSAKSAPDAKPVPKK